MEKKRSSDADVVNSIIARHSAQARNVGKLIAVIVMAVSFITAKRIETPFLFGLLYLAFDYTYFISITLINKWVLQTCFESPSDGFVLREGKNPGKISRIVSHYGSVQMVVNFIVLLTSIILLNI